MRTAGCCAIYFTNGKPVPFYTRQLARDALSELATAGYDYISGLEVEFHVFQLDDALLSPARTGHPAPAPQVSLVTHGFQHLTEHRFDQYMPFFDILRRDLQALGLPLRSLEVEYGPSQVEATFRHADGIEPAVKRLSRVGRSRADPGRPPRRVPPPAPPEPPDSPTGRHA